MCYNPTVSLTTAIIEFVLACILPFKYRFSKLKYFFALFIFLLGFYQLTEYMYCRTGNAELWMKLGFIVYTFLPALGLHLPLMYFKNKTPGILLYIIPAVYSVAALVTPSFITQGACNQIFVTINNALLQTTDIHKAIIFYVYVGYYAGFIIASCAVCLRHYFKEPISTKKKIYLALPIGVLLMTVPTFILLIIFPSLNIMFPSVLCHFALLLALVAFIGVRKEHEYLLKEKVNSMT